MSDCTQQSAGCQKGLDIIYLLLLVSLRVNVVVRSSVHCSIDRVGVSFSSFWKWVVLPQALKNG